MGMRGLGIPGVDYFDSPASVRTDVVDADENDNQLLGNRHAHEVYADDVSTGTNLVVHEVDTDVVAHYSGAAVTKTTGTTANRWSTGYFVDVNVSGTVTTGITDTQVVYSNAGVLAGSANLTWNGSTLAATSATLSSLTATRVTFAGTGGLLEDDAGLTYIKGTNGLVVGTNGWYSQGGHGHTMAADDFAVGSSAASRMVWDNSAGLDLRNATRTGTHETSYTFYASANFGASTGIGWRHSNGTQGMSFGYNTMLAAGSDTNVTLSISSKGSSALTFNNGVSAAVNIDSWSNFGSTTKAVTEGDGAFGITSSGQWFFDESAATQTTYNSSGTATHVINADGATVFNADGAAIDFRVEGVNDFVTLWVDASADSVNIGNSSGATSHKLFVKKTWDHTSGLRYGVRSQVISGNATDGTGSIYANYMQAQHNVAKNVSQMIGFRMESNTTAAASGGTLGSLLGFESFISHAGACAVTNVADIRLDTPTITGAGAVTNWYQILLQDLGSAGTVTNRYGIYQAGTNATNVLESDLKVGVSLGVGVAASGAAGQATFNTSGAFGTALSVGTTSHAVSAAGDQWWASGSVFVTLDCSSATFGTYSPHSMVFQTNNTDRWGIHATTGALIPQLDGTYSIGTNSFAVLQTFTRFVGPDSGQALHILGHAGTALFSIDATESECVINGTGADVDIRFETSNVTNAFFMDGGNDTLSLNVATDCSVSFDVGTGLTLGTGDIAAGSANHYLHHDEDTWTTRFYSNQVNSDGGPILEFWHENSGVAANDRVARFDFYGEDSASNKELYARLRVNILDKTSASEDSNIEFQVKQAGSALTASLSNAGVWTDSSAAEWKVYEDKPAPWMGHTYGGKTISTACDVVHVLEVGVYRGHKIDSEQHISPTSEMWRDVTQLRGTRDGIAAKDLAGLALMCIVEIDDRLKGWDQAIFDDIQVRLLAQEQADYQGQIDALQADLRTMRTDFNRRLLALEP